ncbi:MAG: AAA family ATPase [Fimbriimonas ginsengisoli]|nr:AAA family ATPase [Fimbriimonas ginsengisoli]
MLDEARGYLRAIEHELAATKKEHVRLTAEFAGLEKNPEGLPLSPDLPGLQAVRDNALQALIAGNSDIEQASARIAEAESRLQQAKDRSAACLRRLQAAQEDESHRERRLAKLGPEKERLSEEIARQTDLARKAAVNRAEADSQLAELQTRRAESLRLSGELTEQARAARDQATVASESAHTAELGRARAESRRATAAERLLEEYGIGEDEALAREPTVELPSDAASLAPRLRRELKAMGEVNLGAIDAFERLTSRFDDLDGQRQDILGSIAQLHSSIGELDQLTRDRFLETFGRLQVEFADLFQRLFGGGEGRLTLTDPGEVLDCGIEIDLTLPGKRPQRLELLSGGERALCAIAFLFGLLRVKPSPLVVLDEVDAPLDGRNVERFAEVLSEFSASTQFIVVTHNPATIESAPVWLGVTMQEPGVSTLVPARTPALSYA